MDYFELLQRYDHPTHWQHPPEFDSQAATKRFARFIRDLSAALGQTIQSETGAEIQDASFHSQILLPLGNQQHALIRFSNFGEMVTVSDDDPVPEPTMRVLQEVFSRHGYVYIPATVLATPYTGSNPGVAGISTWWIRYFDWV